MSTPETAAPETGSAQSDPAATAQATSAPARNGGRKDRGERGRRDGERRDRRERRDRHDHRDPRGRHLDLSPPHFNVDELAALAGPPLWQSVHDATVADLTEAAVFVDVKPLGHAPLRAAIPPKELPDAKVGDALRVRLLDAPKAGETVPTASAAQARALDALDRLVALQGKPDGAPGFVVREVKGGYSVALCGANEDDVAGAVRAFLPASQATLSRFGPRAADDVVGSAGNFDMVELDPERANVVVSRRARLAAERKQAVATRLAELKEGDVVTAVVKSIMPYGAFVDVGGLDGLVHQSDMTWDGRSRASDVLRVGAQVQAKVLSKNPETGKLKLGLKQLVSDPWAEVRAAFAAGSVVEGVIVALADFGAFVRLTLPSTQQPIEGLIHISEISWNKVKHPSQRFKIGDAVQVKVLGLDTDERRISLSTKALEKNPFEAVAEKLPVGTVVNARIKSLADFGAFVELADGVDGLIHVGEISWTEHPNHPSELLNIGQEVEAVVISVDVGKQRVGLSMKRTKENPFDGWEKKYGKGARLKLKVVRVDDKGAWLGVEEGLTCYCFVRDLVGKEGDGRVERAQEAVKVGMEIDVEVKSFDRRFKKVSVSMRAVIEGDTREAYDDYKKKEAAEGQKLNPLAEKLKGITVGGEAKKG